MATITAANGTLAITVQGLYTAPVVLEGWAVDEGILMDEVTLAEAQVGVDGYVAYGYVPALKPVTTRFLANSPSIFIFDQIVAQTIANGEVFRLDLTLTLPSVGKRYTFNNGVLLSGKLIPDVKKILQDQDFKMTFESITASIIPSLLGSSPITPSVYTQTIPD